MYAIFFSSATHANLNVLHDHRKTLSDWCKRQLYIRQGKGRIRVNAINCRLHHFLVAGINYDFRDEMMQAPNCIIKITSNQSNLCKF